MGRPENLLKLLIADVTLTRTTQDILVQIRWHTNQVEELKVAPPVRGNPKTPEIIVKRLHTLYKTHTDRQIAEILNRKAYEQRRAICSPLRLWLTPGAEITYKKDKVVESVHYVNHFGNYYELSTLENAVLHLLV